MTIFSDEIAAGVRNGDPDAVGRVYVTLADRLLGYLIARVRDRATAEDILEATFIELLRKGHTITGGPAAIKVWLFRSAYFNAMDHLRKVRRRAEDFCEDMTEVDLEDTSPSPEDLAVAAERRELVHRVMAELSEDQRQVLTLRYLGGLTAPETAEVLGKTEGAVRSLQHRAERAMARLLQSEVGARSEPPWTS